MSLEIDTKYVRLASIRLRNFKQKSSNLFNLSCPYCGDSHTNKSKARGYFFKKGKDLIYHCHNCGIGANVGNFLKHVDGNLHKEYVLERYKSGESNNSRTANTVLNITPPRFDKVQRQKIFEHGEWCDKLPSGHFCLDYIKGRKIPVERHRDLLFTGKFKQFCDTLIPNHGKEINDDARLVIPYFNEYDELIAISGRALETNDAKLRYVTIRTVDSEKKLVYGMNTVDLNETVKIVEGPIDSLFLKNCVASGDSSLSICADSFEANKKILIFDCERRNKEIVKLMQNAIDLGHFVVIWPDSIEQKDINDMVMSGVSPDEIEDIISKNSFTGIEAKLKFNLWKKV